MSKPDQTSSSDASPESDGDSSTRLTWSEIDALCGARHGAPFAVLGAHALGEHRVVRTLQPQAGAVTLIDARGDRHPMQRQHDSAVFAVRLDTDPGGYRLELDENGTAREIVDPYSLPSAIGELDRHLFGEGTHQELWKLLGSRRTTHGGVQGTQFAVWAPNAQRVSVVGAFNDWDGRRHVMRSHPGSGLWDIFLPELPAGTLYKYELIGPNGELLPLKNDPYATYFEQAPGNASIVFDSAFEWTDEAWLGTHRHRDLRADAVSIYEVHAASWRRHEDGRPLSWREMADELVDYVDAQGFTHVELMPVTEHPFDGSWGYQPVGMFAPTSRFGSPDDFRWFVDRCHAKGIGVIMDWVPAHFPSDAHGLAQFDGTHLYEHADPRQGFHQDWNTLIFNYGRAEVVNYLLSNAVYWIREFHLDGLRVDAVASMLYLDYSRNEGEWIPNEHGGRENLEAIAFLKRMNELVHLEGGTTYAEESTSFPQVSRPTFDGGLGFTFKWNMGWMHDMLEYTSRDPSWRRYHHHNLTFGLLYAFSENFVLPFSHDEVVHGKGSMINKMPGDDWQKFANLRALYTMMWTYPGKKLTFMGNEIGQYREWAYAGSLDWHLLEGEGERHRGLSDLVRLLNGLYRGQPALHELDCDAAGFEWIDCTDADQSVISWYRHAADRSSSTITVMNMTPIVRHAYRIGVDEPGRYTELLNSDDARFGGSGQSNEGNESDESDEGDETARDGGSDRAVAAVTAGAEDALRTGLHSEAVPAHERAHSLSLTLPPLGALVLQRIG